ncbi:hypothetical protein A4H97_09430 [Niastella yeongjuensis]|uniref:Uncharacterized protein n=1 Tax=Niastella yeongjuensis TaxID=354355 RepID=A0A1V9EEL9_9BACT|nr:hypothetical protein [Niastella yeongjuensis]OQP44579.1 hypothetical protein A4H97_09430 [Niastella yeongjuensis]SEO82598.1 hypothetical protein SAMN05660816_03658 [Niastella yeongjuensis]
MSTTKKQPESGKVSKKKLSKVVLEKLSSSLTDYHIKDKKLENRLEKVSKLLAGDIKKGLKKETPKKDKSTRRKKAQKKEKIAVPQ